MQVVGERRVELSVYESQKNRSRQHHTEETVSRGLDRGHGRAPSAAAHSPRCANGRPG